MDLEDLIIRKIKVSGPILFRDYMDLALYHPVMGYYNSTDYRIGKRGDYFTSPYISRAFGAMVARQIEDMWRQIPENFMIVEYGAGSGLLCHDILQYLKTNMDCHRSIQYIIIEKSPVLRNLSQRYLKEKVIWIDDIGELGEFEGCIISNELFDNFPVHKVCNENGQLMDIWVDHHRGFREIASHATPRIMEYGASVRLDLPDNSTTEICLDAEKWFRDISKYLTKGYIITIDYGYLNEALHRDKYPRGSIRSFKNHRMTINPYEYPGEQDITADVNYSAMIYWGFRNGFDFTGFVNQHYFLKALGFVPYLLNMDDTDENKKYACTTLLERMGDPFKVLIQQKGMPLLPLRGLAMEQPHEKKICRQMAV